MNLLKIGIANIRSKPWNTFLSLLLLAFGVGIISLLLIVQKQLQDQFDRNIKDIDLVVGAKGSPLQLILSAVYQVDAPTGNISMMDAKRISKKPYIESAIQLAYGDNYEKYRIVGTEFAYPEHYGATVATGRLWEKELEATIGSKVAEESGLAIGDTFFSSHGLVDQTDVHTEYAFEVVGIFEQSNSVVDQLILTDITSLWAVHGTLDAPLEEQEITALLLTNRNSLAPFRLRAETDNSKIQVAIPAIEINRLTENFGLGLTALTIIGLVIMVISFISVFISLYNSLKDRKYELALIRTMGGSRTTLLVLILQEGLILAVVGFILGVVFSRVAMLILSARMDDNFHYSLSDLGFVQWEWFMLALTIFVGILASLLPAIRAWKIDISKTLADG
jgi:putative ABC transport system permease protein